ncbi:hypothetical protein L914_01766 [Phytophthora nicotianae]|uniref:Uncharacterized protein n=1 Tax=Phytophthora nicotianae TaxID=4792 RepID=W2P2N7_PHYNI|nr:hypothetical protein L914_01766 [Phytophthora nicotianae]
MANVLRFTTHYVAEQIEPEYAAALYKADSYKYEVDSDDTEIVLVFGANRSRRVSSEDTAHKREREEATEAKDSGNESLEKSDRSSIECPDTNNASSKTQIFSIQVKVRINPKARKVGRPQMQRKPTAASERSDRKWFKAAEKGELQLEGIH